MNSLILGIFASLAFANAAPGGHGGTVISGPAGIVTNHGAIGPAGHGHGGYDGYDGGYDGGYGGGYGGGHGALVAGPVNHGATVLGPAAPAASVIGPVHAPSLIAGGGYGGHGGFGGYGGYAGYGGHGGFGGHGGYATAGLGYSHGGGFVGIGHHGVAVKGPQTVPAVIAGPAGKIVADGLYGVPAHGHGHW